MNLAFLNKDRRRIVSYSLLALSAILYTISIQFFVGVAKTLPSGVGAFAILPLFIWKLDSGLFSIFYIAFNIPLFIYFIKKNKIKFMIKTAFFILFQSLLGIIFIIEPVKEWTQEITQGANGEMGDLNRELVWPIIVLSLVGSVIMGFSLTLAFIAGGSTGGTDIIVYYFSTKLRKSIGGIMRFITFTIVILSMGLSIWLNEDIKRHWLVTIISTILYVLISTFIVNRLYPKYKLIKVDVVSNEYKKINKFLKESSYNHSWRLEVFKSGYLNSNAISITSIIFLLEKKEFVYTLKKIDPNCWISITPVNEVIGRMDFNNLEKHT